MLRSLIIAMAAFAAACSPSAEDSAAISTAPLGETEAKQAAPPTDAWIGRWVGVEGNVLEIGAGGAPGVYSVVEGTLDGLKSYVGVGNGMTIEFEAAGKSYTIHMYEGANHAFNNDTSQARYNRAAAELAWGRTVAFFRRQVAG